VKAIIRRQRRSRKNKKKSLRKEKARLISKFNFFKKFRRKEEDLLALEISEVNDITDIIFERLNRKIEVLEAIEASVDEKINMLEGLIQKAETFKAAGSKTDKQREVASLGRKGMNCREIACMLDIPVGEVELLLGLEGISNTLRN
jgi:DNA-directed RNA polymerase specialized sigma24 family protein